jgi:hypothetical protein
MILRNPPVVHRGPLAAGGHAFHRHGTAVLRQQPVADLQHPRRNPALAHNVERMLRRRLEPLPGHVQVPERGRADEDLFHFLEGQRAIRVELVAGPEAVADLDGVSPFLAPNITMSSLLFRTALYINTYIS